MAAKEFDVDAALKAGYSKEDIKKHMEANKLVPKQVGTFDVDGALNARYSIEDIKKHMADNKLVPKQVGTWNDVKTAATAATANVGNSINQMYQMARGTPEDLARVAEDIKRRDNEIEAARLRSPYAAGAAQFAPDAAMTAAALAAEYGSAGTATPFVAPILARTMGKYVAPSLIKQGAKGFAAGAAQNVIMDPARGAPGSEVQNKIENGLVGGAIGSAIPAISAGAKAVLGHTASAAERLSQMPGHIADAVRKYGTLGQNRGGLWEALEGLTRGGQKTQKQALEEIKKAAPMPQPPAPTPYVPDLPPVLKPIPSRPQKASPTPAPVAPKAPSDLILPADLRTARTLSHADEVAKFEADSADHAYKKALDSVEDTNAGRAHSDLVDKINSENKTASQRYSEAENVRQGQHSAAYKAQLEGYGVDTAPYRNLETLPGGAHAPHPLTLSEVISLPGIGSVKLRSLAALWGPPLFLVPEGRQPPNLLLKPRFRPQPERLILRQILKRDALT